MKSYIVIILSVLANFIHQVLLKSVAIQIEDFNRSFDEIFFLCKSYIFNVNFILSICFFVLSSILWILGLKKITLSKAIALTSINFILIVVYSSEVLNEELSLKKTLSCIFIVVGVLLISISKNENQKLTT